MNPYGRFDDANREYVITRPDTPLPWINYLGCEEYLGIISNTAGGYSFYRDARLRRLMRYRYNNVPLDSNGRYLYIRDGENLWNPGWKPTRTELDEYCCRHGLGYTRTTGKKDDLEASVEYFVPLGETMEVWDVTLRNTGTAPKEVTLYPFLEWCLWDAQDDMTNVQRNFSTGQVEVEEDGRSIFHVTEYRERRNHFAYFRASRPVDGFDTSRDAFVGLHDGLEAPRAIRDGGCTGSVAHGWALVAAQQITINLASGQEERMHFLLGYAENPPTKKFSAPGVVNKAPFQTVRQRFATSADVDAARQRLAEYWEQLLSGMQVEIDNPHLQRMVNTWNQYQCMTTFNLSRSASMFESGIGRGMGYRDSNQDILGFVHLRPADARQRLCDLAATQLSDGTCFHQYQPLTKKGNADIGGGFNDDPLWLILAVAAYLKETGDWTVLVEEVGYADQENSSATLLDHMELSLHYIRENRGPHGLPLIGHADWNDCLNLNCFSETPGESFQLAGDIGGSNAESVMIAGLFCAAAGDMQTIYSRLDRISDAERVAAWRSDMVEVMQSAGWDGAWFVRAYDAAGKPVGSAQCDEGQIFIESQGWAVLGGVGLNNGKARQALDSVAKGLACEHGIILQQPAYKTYRVELGEITSYPPGYKENAGIFTHNNTWIQIAECLLGHGDKAMEYYLAVCPSRKEDIIDLYRCEPYVYSQTTAGPDAPTFGEGKNSWLTGTAAWSLVAASQYILGLQPDYDGLRINPCLPKNCPGFTARRVFRGKTFQIKVVNGPVGHGVASMTLNGTSLDGNLLPIEECTAENIVEVRLQ